MTDNESTRKIFEKLDENNRLLRETSERVARIEERNRLRDEQMTHDSTELRLMSPKLTRVEERQAVTTKLVWGAYGAIGVLVLEALKIFEATAIEALIGS